MDISTGKVICRSTSSGTREGETVLICTCTGVVSGKASMGSRESENTPETATAAAPARTR
jgi:hypothetical protein